MNNNKNKIDKKNQEDFYYFQTEFNIQNNSDEMIHHYTSPQGLIGIFCKKNIWHTNINCLNDKSEYQYTYNLIKTHILPKYEQILKKHNLYELLNSRCENLVDTKFYKLENEVYFNRNYYIACFSKAKDSLPMWNYYSCNGNSLGYSLNISKSMFQEFLLEKVGINNLLMAEVCYNEDRQKEILEEVFNRYIYDNNALDNTEQYNLLFDNIRICSLFFKHPKYSYEQEIRNIVIERSDQENSKIKFREKQGIIIPYIEFEFNLNMLLSVTVAPNNDKEYIKYCVHNLARENGRFGIKVIDSEIPAR